MDRGKQETGVRLLRVQDLPGVRMRDALLRAVRSLKTRPEPRWKWDNVAANRSTPWRALFRMLAEALRAGAPLEDVTAVLHEMEGQLAVIAAKPERPADIHGLALAMVDEVRADGAADVAQAEVTVAPSRTAIERLIETRESQVSAGERIVALARQILQTPLHRVPRGAAS